MKKVLFLNILLLLLLAQSNAQVLKKGDFVFDAYYGGPNLSSIGIKLAYKDFSNFVEDDFKFSSFGPVGFRAEYILSKNIGVGLNFNYAHTKVRGVLHETKDLMGNPIDNYYAFKAEFPRLRFLPTVFFHVSDIEKWDPYFSLALGYNRTHIKETTDDPIYALNSVKFKLSPFSYRIEGGIRYFFVPNFGVHAQVGFAGGPLIGFGLTGKI